MYQVGDRVKVKFVTPEGRVIKESKIIDTELHPNGSIAYRLESGMFVRNSEIIGKAYKDEYTKQKQELKV